MAANSALPGAAIELIDFTSQMTTHGGRSSPAPHKPLLVLWAIWRRALTPAAPRLIPYDEVHAPMVQLLTAAGRTRNPRPWYPFVRLAREPFWELDGLFAVNQAGDVSSVAGLTGVAGGFLPVYAQCLTDRSVATHVAAVVSTTWFPAGLASRLNDFARDLAGAV
jgi:hypothetical protein